MYYFYYGLHLIAVFSWAIFLLQFIKSYQNDLDDKYIFGFLSLFMMFVVLFVGTKLMLLNPSVSKSGNWLHVKLSFDILLMIENITLLVFVFKRKTLSKKILEILYWLSYAAFVLMVALSVFRPF
jgi:uncharacterized membrane protein